MATKLISEDRIKIITDSYLNCASWVDKPYELLTWNDKFTQEFSKYAKEKASHDCTMLYMNIQLCQIDNGLSSVNLSNKETLSHLGADFWLTRNFHSAGFWEGNDYWSDKDGQELTRICQENFERLGIYISEKTNQIEFEQG